MARCNLRSEEMTDKELVQEQYRKMFDAMIRTDRACLDAVLDEGFVLVHMMEPALWRTER